MNKIDEINKDDYIVTHEDLIRILSRTTGIVESKLDINGTEIRLYDVGNQRNRYWRQCFDILDMMIIVVSLCDYVDDSDNNWDNRMARSLQLFTNVVNNRYWKHTNIILLRNMTDLFEERVKRKSIDKCPLFDEFDEFV